MKVLKIIGIILLIVIILPLIIGLFTNKSDKTASTATVASTPKKTPEQLASEKQKAESDKVLANAQKEYEQKKQTEVAKTMPANSSDLKTTTQEMDFDKCLLNQKTMEDSIKPNYKSLHLVSTGAMSVVRFCTNDGSVLSTCNAADRKLIAVQSSNMEGCR